MIDILSAAKFITPELGELPPALKARLGDSNKNLVSFACSGLDMRWQDLKGNYCVFLLGDHNPDYLHNISNCYGTTNQQTPEDSRCRNIQYISRCKGEH